MLNQKPRNPRESILTKDFLQRVGIQGGLIAVVTILAFYSGLRVSSEMACTMAFSTLCLARLFHGFNCRGIRSVFHLPKNLYSIGAFALGTLLLMAVLLIPALHGLFDISNALTRPADSGNRLLRYTAYCDYPVGPHNDRQISLAHHRRFHYNATEYYMTKQPYQ